MAITGIYKITSPTGKVYIGQSWDVRSRWAQHKRRDSKGMVISKSIAKHGADSHLFSLVHELPKDVTQDVMDIYEQLYMDAYRCCGVQLLNSREGGSAGRLSPETIKKMSESRKGRRMSESAKIKLRAHRIGKPLSEEHKEKLRISSIGKNKGLVRSAETRLKYSEAKKGQVLSEETKDKLRKLRIEAKISEKHKEILRARKGIKNNPWKVSGANQWKAKTVIDTATGEKFETIYLAAQSLGLKRSTLEAMLSGQNPNRTTLVYAEKKPTDTNKKEKKK